MIVSVTRHIITKSFTPFIFSSLKPKVLYNFSQQNQQQQKFRIVDDPKEANKLVFNS